jgi:hypothetical protein
MELQRPRSLAEIHFLARRINNLAACLGLWVLILPPKKVISDRFLKREQGRTRGGSTFGSHVGNPSPASFHANDWAWFTYLLGTRT